MHQSLVKIKLFPCSVYHDIKDAMLANCWLSRMAHGMPSGAHFFQKVSESCNFVLKVYKKNTERLIGEKMDAVLLL